MLRLLPLTLVAALAACTTTAAPAARTAAFGIPQSLAVGETATYPDALAVTLERIDDSRCPPDAQCAWAGELAATFTLRGGGFGEQAREVTLGTGRGETATAGAYTLVLGPATTARATVTVTH